MSTREQEPKRRLCEVPLLKYDSEIASHALKRARRHRIHQGYCADVDGFRTRRLVEVLGNEADVELTKAFRNRPDTELM